ncbi:MAG: hypothetical protein QOC85_1182, partial [Streptomyces sp.]|nr:hypothetical protein [Streptomyces sp.]
MTESPHTHRIQPQSRRSLLATLGSAGLGVAAAGAV